MAKKKSAWDQWLERKDKLEEKNNSPKTTVKTELNANKIRENAAQRAASSIGTRTAGVVDQILNRKLVGPVADNSARIQKRQDEINSTLQPAGRGITSTVNRAGGALSGQAKRENSVIDKLGITKKEVKNPEKTLVAEDLTDDEIASLKRYGTKNFLEKSLEEQKNNPNSKLNQTARKQIMGDINLSAQAKNLNKILNPVSEEGKGSWLGQQTDEYKQAMALGTAQQNIQLIDELRNKGYLNATGDVNKYDRKQLALEQIKLNRRKNELESKIAGFDEELKKYDGSTQMMPDGLQLIKSLGKEEDRQQIEIAQQQMQEYPESSVQYMQAEELLEKYAQQGDQLAQKYLNLSDEYGTMGTMRWNSERLYDAINGDGSYMQAVSEMSLEEKDEFDKAIEEVLPSYERLTSQRQNAEDELGTVNDKISRLSKEQEERTRYTDLMGTEATGSTEYNDEYYTYQPNTWRKDADNFVNYQTDDIHRIVSFINGGQEYDMWAAGTSGQITNDYSGALNMLPAEKEKLTALYNQAMQQGKEPTEAKAFFEGLQPYLNERYRMYEEMRNQYAARTIPILSSAGNLMMTMTQPLEAIRTGIGLATGKEWAKDPYSWNFANTRAMNDIENQVSKDLGDVGGFLYKGAMSGLKNAARGLVAMGTGGAAQVVTLAEFFGENFMNSYQQTLVETQDEAYSAKKALVDSAISTFFEIASVEALFGDPKNFVLYMLKNTGAEMSEEYFEAEFGPYIERALMGRSEWDKRKGEILYNRGYYDNDGNWVPVTEKNAGEAAKQAEREKNAHKWEAVGSAAISTLGAGVFGAARNFAESQDIGQALLKSGSVQDMQKEAMRDLQQQNALKMTEAGIQMPEGSKSREKAEDLKADLDAGKKISPLKYGELAKALVSETNEEIGKIATQVLQNKIEQDLKDDGVKNAEKLAGIVAKRVVGAEMSMAERFALSQNEAAKKAAIAYGYQLPTGRVAEATKEIEEKTADTRSIQETISEMLGANEDRTKAVGDVARMMDGAQLAGAVTRVMSNGKATQVSIDGNVADITGFKTETVNGEKRIMVTLSDGQTADIADVKAISENAAKVLRFVQMDGNRIGSDRVSAVLLKHANETQDIASMVYDAMRVRVSSVLGLNAPKNGLSAEMVNEIRQAAQEDFNEAEEKRVQNQRQIRPGNGRAVFNGVVYGTNAFTEAIKKLNRVQRNEAFAIGVIAKAAGLDVELYNDPQNTKEQGSYTAAGGIRINLAGTFNEEGWHRGALATFAHEITHQLEGNSREAYAQLRQFVINNLQKNGENVEQRLRGIMDTYAKNGQQLDLNGAIAELVAKSSEQVLTDENVIRQLRESDPNLYGRIRKVVSNLVDRIRTAIGMARETSSYYSKALGNVADELNQKWMLAYAEAKQAQRTAAGTGAQLSVMEMSDGTKIAIEDNNILNQKPADTSMADYIYNYLTEHIGDSEIVESTTDVIYLGKALPSEYISSDYTTQLKRGNKKKLLIKNRAAGVLLDAIVAAENKKGPEPAKHKNKNAKLGVYKYKTKIAFPVRNTSGEIVDYNVYDAQMVVNHTGKGNLELYDILDITKDTATGSKLLMESAHGSLKTIRHQSSASGSNLAQTNNNSKSQKSIQDDEKALQADLEERNGPETHYGDHKQFSLRVTDPDELDFLNNQDTVTTYKSMQLIDGKLYPPMAAVVAGQMEDYSELGQWEKATEHPELIKKGNKFTLNKGKGKGSLDAAYNPYMHSSNLMINDQFSGAYNRPNLVTVECVVPVSELDSGYHAEYAKDNAGWHSWHTGPVAGQLRQKKGTERQVMLSRWIKPVRIVPDAEVAQHYKKLLAGTDIAVPDNVITPGLRDELVKAGVKIQESGRVQKSIRDEIDKTTEKQANNILKKNGAIAYVPAQYSFAGEGADEKYSDKVRQAFRMERNGASDDEIRKETNCIRGYNGRWWLILDNNKMGLKVPVDEIKTDKPYHLFQIYDADELMEAYPKIKWSWVRFADLGRGVTGSTEPHKMEITVSTEQLKRGKDFVEATLQHEIQHLIQTVEGTESGASVEFWKDMQDMARARIAFNDREINKLYEKYGIDATRELAFGIEFNEDGSLDEEWLFPEELEKIRKMTPEELNLYRDIEKDSEKWIKLLQNNRTYENLYLNTVGEIEARAAAEKTDENTKIRYPDNAVTTEEYTRTPTSKAGASLLPKDDIDHLFGKDRQFSMQEAVEENGDGLIAVHNLNEDQLIKTMGLGGFPMPSIAVIKNDYAHNRYGDISVVFYPSTIDPQASRYNKVYGGDAWTPTYPTIEYKLNTKLLDRAMKQIDKLLPADFRTDQVEMYADNLEKSINSARGDMIQAIKDNRRLQLAYLYDRGEKFTIPTREKRLTSGFDNEEVKAVAEALGEELVTEAYENGYQYMDAHPEVVKKIVDTLNNQWKEKIKGKVTTLKLLNMVPYETDKFGFNKFDNITGGAYRYFRQGTTGETDEYALRDALEERINEEDYINWLHEKFDGLVEKSGVRNNKDYFTNSGTPRSWEALHDEETLENIVNIMRSQNSKGENAFFSQSAMLALGTKDFRSLEDIRKSKGQLQHLTEEEYSAAKENIINGFSELMDELMDKGDNNPFIARQRALEAMVEAVRKSKTPAGIMRELREWRGLDLKEDVGQRIAALVKEIGELPTEYFEAKPQRGVGFDEIAKVAIPENASQRLKTMMDQYGIPYETYDGTDEDRLRVLNSVKDAQFSFMDETELDVGHWMMTVKEDALQTEAEKQMLKKYKDLRMRLDLREMRKSELRNKIAPIEMIPEAQRSEDQKRQLKKLNDQLGHTQRVIDDTLEELARASSAEGFARMMYQESKVLNNFIYGRTQAEVRDAVEAMEKNAGTVAARIAENQAAIKELEKSGVVQAVKKMLGRTTVEQAAADLKKKYNSTWTRTEILNYLNPIVLKMTQGEDISFDVEELAGILIDSDRTNVYEGLSALRGLTITLGKGQQQELKAQNSSLKEIRRRLAGTGIQVKYGDRSTLEADIESLREEYPEMPDFGNEKNALENFVSWVEGMKRSGADQFYDQNLAEAMAVIMQKAASAMNGIYMPTESKAQKQVLALVEYIKTLNAKTEKLEKNLTEIAADMEKMQKAGANATSMVNVLHRDVNIAIDYYNKMAKIAEDNAKQQKQNKIIEQLKSKHAQQILKNNEEWRNLIERDKQARAQAEDNRLYRNWINRSLRTMYQKLRNPKGMNNIPEYMQGLAREVLETFVDNDLAGGMRFTDKTLTELAEVKRVLEEWKKESRPFNIADINEAEEVVATIISNDLMTIYDGIAKINSEIRGKNRLDTLQQRGEILRKMQEAVTEIWTAIKAENTVQIRNRRIAVEDQAYKIAQLMGNLKKKEWTGKAGKGIATLHKFIVSGNMTPEYFFRMLDNEGLSDLWENYHDAENRNGLELKQAQQRLAEIAKQYGYEKWDTQKKFTLTLESGQKVDMTLGQLMSLWATWKREIALGPNVSEHLAGGGFYAEQDTREGILGKAAQEKRSHRIKVIRNEQGEIVKSPDMDKVSSLLTEEQKKFVDEVVGYMSNDMSELGNEASMAAYGIKLYKEKYYFPFQMWDGVRSRKSNDAGSAAAANDRAFHPSFSKSRIHGARNALVIGDFMQTAADHIAGMINYATMGLANENLQKTLNTQLQQSYGEDEINKRNIWTMMEEAYGKEAVQYLRKLQEQLNGGAVKVEKTFYDKLISLFRKNAVAGSLSVAMQQPLSYIRAAMMVNPKYLAQALNPIYWKGSYAEMLKHSGVAVIKDMGRFDMNFGQSAREFLMPDAQESNLKRTWEFVKDKATILPEMMDRATWTRMWSAIKAEQKALHPEMDAKSDEFLDMVGERFNDVMRRTQVYDSVLVKSANMRSENPVMKQFTSFMAEPTLTINVLADAVRQAKKGEKGGKIALAKAGATFLLSAVLQAAVKGLMASGRTPDDKKTWLENFLNRFGSNLMNEADPLQLIPGYSDLITVLKDGKLQDDAMGALGKIFTAGQTGIDMLMGNGDKSPYRMMEDSVGQLIQLFSGLPMKNIMRDMRAMYNFVNEGTYAQRDTSAGVLKYQLKDSIMTADNLFGVINDRLGAAGWETKNSAYYQRIYQAKKEGREQDAQDMIDYLLKGRGVKQTTLNTGISNAAKNDTGASAADTAEFLIEEGGNAEGYIRDQLKDEKMTPAEAREMLHKADPEKSADSIWWTVDRIVYAEEHNLDSVSGNYYRLYDAIDSNKVEEIREAVRQMTEHGVENKNIKTQIGKKYKTEYLAVEGSERRKLKDALTKAYKAIGMTEEEAIKLINSWK